MDPSANQNQPVIKYQLLIGAVSIKREDDEEGDERVLPLIPDSVTQKIVNQPSYNALSGGNEAPSFNTLPPASTADARMSSVSHDSAHFPSNVSSHHGNSSSNRVDSNGNAVTTTIQKVRSDHNDPAMSNQLNPNMMAQHNQRSNAQSEPFPIGTIPSSPMIPSGSSVTYQLASSSRPPSRIAKPGGTLNGEFSGELEGKEMMDTGAYFGSFAVNCKSANFNGLFNGVNVECPEFSFTGRVFESEFSGIFKGSRKLDPNNEYDSFIGTFKGKLEGTFEGRCNVPVISSAIGRPIELPQSGQSAIPVNEVGDNNDDDVQWIEPPAIEEKAIQRKSKLPIQLPSQSSGALDQSTNTRPSASGSAPSHPSRLMGECNDADDEEEEPSNKAIEHNSTSQQQPHNDQSHNQSLDDQQNDDTSNNNASTNDIYDQDRIGNDNPVGDDVNDDRDEEGDHDNDDHPGDSKSSTDSSTEESVISDDESSDNEPHWSQLPPTSSEARIAETESVSSASILAQRKIALAAKRIKGKINYQIDPRDNSATKRIIYVKCSEIGCKKTFVNYTILNQHMRAEHINCLCPYCCFAVGCEERFLYIHQIWQHLSTHHQERTEFECPTCKNKFNSQYNASRHASTHIKGELICTLCTCRKHMIDVPSVHIHLNGQKKSCGLTPECGKHFKDLVSLDQHQNSIHYSLSSKTALYCKMMGCGESRYALSKRTMIMHFRSVHKVPSDELLHFFKINTNIVPKGSIDMNIQSISKSKLPIQPSNSKRTFDSLTQDRPSTSAPKRSMAGLHESNEEQDEALVSRRYFHQPARSHNSMYKELNF